MTAKLNQELAEAQQALEQQDWLAIQEGIAQADAGDTMPLDEADRRVRDEFGFTPQP